MKSIAFILAVYVLPGSADLEIIHVGYFGDQEHCRTEARAIIQTLRKQHPSWVHLGFNCRPKRPSDNQVTPLSEFLPNA